MFILAGGCRGAQRAASRLTLSYAELIVLTHQGDEASMGKHRAVLLIQLPPNCPVSFFKCFICCSSAAGEESYLQIHVCLLD